MGRKRKRRGRRRQSRRGEKKSSLYLFYDHSEGHSSVSLYKINLQDGVPATKLLPTLENLELFDTSKYVTGMTCALLGSKFYFLGGQRRINYQHDDHEPDYEQIFPRHVYEFDITTDGPLKKMEASLNTGKPGPCVFAAAGKIYALGTRMTYQNYFDPVQDKVQELTKELKLFECFDPFTKQWQHLPDPPTNELVRWTGCNVLEQRQQVVLSAKEFGKDTTTVLVYDLHLNDWTYYANPSTYNIMTALSIQEGDSHGHLYGLPADRAPVRTKSNYFNLDTLLRKSNSRQSQYYYYDDDDDDDDGLDEMSVPGKGKSQLAEIFIHRHYFDYLDSAKRLLRYLGDGHFCYIDSGQFFSGPDRCGEPICYDLYTRGITITLCKEISDGDDDDDTIDGNTSSKSGGDYFKAKILHSRKYVIKTPLGENLATLEKCFVV